MFPCDLRGSNTQVAHCLVFYIQAIKKSTGMNQKNRFVIEQFKASDPEAPPKREELDLVGPSFEFF